eukprot:m.92306 g.92306  ORF g.92306 m.92306 type:complete len:479 (-) comp8888_c1_seq4:93-1529(-)
MNGYYVNKVILAPMVRVGTLPARLLALKYGADLVYGEEVVDYKMARCERIENPVLETIDFVSPEGVVVFRTCAEEKKQVVFQVGTSNPDRAVEVLKIVQNDVFGFDVNMGCPKKFSIKGGMGAALLSDLDLSKDIMKALVDAASIPVTMKMRMLSSKEKTVEFMQGMESTGIEAIGLHGRQRHHRPVVEPDTDMMREVVAHVKIPVIANGGSTQISSYEKAMAWKEKTGCASIMLARCAQNNLSIFRKEGPLRKREVAREYFKLAVRYDNTLANTKYCLLKLLSGRDPTIMVVARATEAIDVARVFELEEYYLAEVERQHELAEKFGFKMSQIDDQIDEAKGTPLELLLAAEELSSKDENEKEDGGNDDANDIGDQEEQSKKRAKLLENLISKDIEYKQSFFKKRKITPRMHLDKYATLCGKEEATFDVRQQLPSRKYFSICNFDGVNYSHTEPIANKRKSLQASALVALMHLSLYVI